VLNFPPQAVRAAAAGRRTARSLDDSTAPGAWFRRDGRPSQNRYNSIVHHSKSGDKPVLW
jgi:hypothetical protein